MDRQLLSDMIRSLSVSSNECRGRAQNELDKWYDVSLTLLRDAYDKKSSEIDRLFYTVKEDLDIYKQRQLASIARQRNDLLHADVEQLKEQLPTIIQVKSTPGSIYDLEICRSTNIIDRPTACSALRYSLSRTEPVQSLRFSSTCRAMTCSAKRGEILLYDKDELILYNVDGTLGGSVSWSTIEDGFVSDIAWCSLLDRFLILSRMKLSMFDPHLYTCRSVKQVRGTQANHLIALAYVEQTKSVFVCCHHTTETVRQYDVLSDWTLTRTWSKDNLINHDDSGIRCIRANASGTQMGLVIKNKNDQFRIGLFSMDLTHLFATISILPSPLSSKGQRSVDFMLYLAPFIADHLWLVVYGNGTREHSLLLIDGQTERSETVVCDSMLNACMLDEQYLIVRMKQSILIYDIQ